MARSNAKTTDATSRDDVTAGAQASVPARAEHAESLKSRTEHEGDDLAQRLEELADPLRDRLRKPVTTVNGWWKWASTLKPYRVWTQFSHNDGNLRTAGMSYQSLFAVFAALWVGFSFAGIWLSSNPAVMDALVRIINDAIPGLIGTSSTPGIITEAALRDLGTAFGWSSIIASIGLLWTAIAWLYYTRQAVRAMFDLDRDERNYVLQKITDLGLAIVFGAVLLASAIVSAITTEAMQSFLDWVGIANDKAWTTSLATVIGFGVATTLNFLVLSAMFRVLSRVVIPWRHLIVGPLLGAIALVVLSALSGLLIGTASKNPLLAGFGVFVGMLLLFNWMCRVILLAAAWIAVDMFDHGLDPRKRTPEQIAYEKALAAYTARLLVAQADVADAERAVAGSRWVTKWFANRRLRDARDELQRVTSEPRPQPPRKPNWWLDAPASDAEPKKP